MASLQARGIFTSPWHLYKRWHLYKPVASLQAVASIQTSKRKGLKAIRLPFGGAGIRSIEYDESRKAFFPITGAGPNSEKMDRRLKPEGITRVSTGTRDFVFIVFDTSGYAATE